MLKKTLFLILLPLIAFCKYQTPLGCTPFGVRLALGLRYYSPTSLQQMSVRFNTREQCKNSFISINLNQVIFNISCTTQKISFKKYTSYVHKCSISNLNRGDHYSYQAYGWAQGQNPIGFKQQFIKTKVLGPGDARVLVFGDQSYLEVKKYDRLQEAFNSLISSDNPPDIVFLNGDYAYDLSSRNGRKYQNFLIMLSQISSTWPCMFNIGNHQHNSNNDYMIFSKSFENYGLADQKVTSLDLEAFTLLVSDPYNVIFGSASKQNYLQSIKSHLQKAKKNKPIIAATHYHLACGGACSKQKQRHQLRNTLPELFSMLIDYNAILYIASHVHTYQRYFPYKQDDTFQLTPGPYTMTNHTKYLISIVEGISGNDQGMVMQYDEQRQETAATSYGNSGYGIMTVNSTTLKYEHFKAKNWLKNQDQFTINFKDILEQMQYNNIRTAVKYQIEKKSVIIS